MEDLLEQLRAELIAEAKRIDGLVKAVDAYAAARAALADALVAYEAAGTGGEPTE